MESTVIFDDVPKHCVEVDVRARLTRPSLSPHGDLSTFSLLSPLQLGLGVTICVEGMLTACFFVCDRSDKRRKDKKMSEFVKIKT